MNLGSVPNSVDRGPAAGCAHPPRVMQMLVGEQQGGAERFFVKLAGALEERGVPQRLVVGREPQRLAALRDAGCDVLPLSFGGLGDTLQRLRLRRAVLEFQPDVFVVWMDRAARRLPRGPFVKFGRLGGYYRLRHYRRCDHLIANTPDILRYIREQGWPAERAHMISNFPDMPLLPPASRAEHDTPAGVPLLVALGRLHPQKGFDVLLRALAHVPGAYLWLAGEGGEREALRRQASELGVAKRVRFLGWRNDQSALLAAADICVVPSRHEPLSNVVLEAWLHGVPVVAAASEGPRWLIDDGRNGLLVPVDDPAALAAALKAVLTQPSLAAALAQGGAEAYRRGFSREAVTNQYINLFTAAASATSAHRWDDNGREPRG